VCYAHESKLPQPVQEQDLAKLFERLCEQNQQKKFDAIQKKLDELTKKASEEITKRPVNPNLERSEFLSRVWD
jgi:transcriptional regulator of heat shock response